MSSEARREDRGGVVVTLPTAGAWLTSREASAHTRICKTLIYRACAAGHLRHVRAGGSFRFKVAWLDEWVHAGAKSTVVLQAPSRTA